MIPTRGRHQLLLAVGDIDGDHRAEVVVAHAGAGESRRGKPLAELIALDGPDARVLWRWSVGNPEVSEICALVLARVEGGRRQPPGLALGDPHRWERILQLDARGAETWSRDMPALDIANVEAIDLDGDGNDEFGLATTTGLQLLASDGTPLQT